jgi:hypothetical protein
MCLPGCRSQTLYRHVSYLVSFSFACNSCRSEEGYDSTRDFDRGSCSRVSAGARPIIVKIVSTTRSKARTAVLAGEGDAEGAAIWRQITAAVEELQRERRPSEPVN